MKKTFILTSLLLILNTFAFGQSNSWYIGGQAGFNKTSTKLNNSNTSLITWSFSPEAGYFLSDYWAIGLGANVTGTHSTFNNGGSSSTMLLGGSLYGRRFFGTSAFRPFVGLQTSYLGGTLNQSMSEYESQTSFSVQGIAGFAYYVTPRIGIFGSIGVLGYSYLRQTKYFQPDEVSNDFGFDISTLGNRFNIGMYYTLGKRTKE